VEKASEIGRSGVTWVLHDFGGDCRGIVLVIILTVVPGQAVIK
jgi:hypothetical protein